MAEQGVTPQKAPSKLESLPKEDLLKLLKKQANNTKDLKKKLEEVTTALKNEKSENERLEGEIKEWISHGVSAEFEKKSKITRKEQELELAAQLGKEMLAENDGLQKENSDLKSEFEETVKNYEDELDKMMQDKVMLEQTLQSMQDEYKSAKQEVLDNKEAWKVEKEENEFAMNSLQQEIKELKAKNKSLNDSANSHSTNASTKIKKMKEKLEETLSENGTLKQSIAILKKENKEKSEKMLSLDQELKTLRNEILEYQQQNKLDMSEIDNLQNDRNAMLLAIKESETQSKLLDGELLKGKGEREKLQKSLKTMKTKFERAVQMEEELKKQLGTIVGERDDLMKKLQRANKNMKGKGKQSKSPRDDESSHYDDQIKELQDEIVHLQEENTELRNSFDGSESLDEKYQALQKDIHDLNSSLHEATSIRDRLDEEKNQLANINTSLEEDKQTLDEKYKDLQQVYEQCLMEKDSVICQLSVLQFDLHTLKEQAKQLSDKIEENERNKEEGFLKENKVDWNNDKETKATILKLEARIDELLNQLQRLNEEKLNQETELEELFKSQDDLLNKYDFECQERQRAEKQIRDLEEQLSQHENNENQDKTLDELKETIRHLEESVVEVTQSRDQYKQEVSIKDECVQQLRHEIEELGRKYSEVNALNNKAVDKIVSEVQQLDEELNHTREDLDEMTRQNENLSNLNRTLEQTKNELESSLESSNQATLKLQEDYEALQQQLGEFGEKEHSQSKSVETKDTMTSPIPDERNAELEDSIRSSEELIERLKSELLSSNSRNTKLEEEVSIQSSTIKSNDEEVERLKNELTNLNVRNVTTFEESDQRTEIEEHEKIVAVSITDQESISDLSKGIVEQETSVDVIDYAKTEMNEVDRLKDIVLKKDEEIETLSKQLERESDKTGDSGVIDKYNDVIHEKEAVMQQLTELQEEHLNLGQAYQEVRAELESLRNSEENYVNESHEKQTIILKLNAEIVALKNRENDIERLKSEVEKFGAQQDVITGLNAEISTLKDSLDESRLLVEKKTIQLEDLKREVDQKETSFAVITDECSVLNLTLEESKNQLSEKDEELIDLTKSYECLQGDKQSLEKALAQLKEHNDQLTKTVTEREHQTQNLQNLYEENVQLVDSLKETLSNETDKATVIEELEQHKIANERIESELQSAFNRIEELEAALVDSNKEVKERMDKGVKLRNVAIKAKKEMESMRSRIEEEKSMLEGQIATLMEEGKALKNELVHQKTSCSKHEEEFEDMRKEIESLQDQLDQEKSGHSKTSNNITSFEGKIDALTISNSQKENRIVELEQSNANLKTRLDQLSRDLENGKMLVESKVKECEELKARLESVDKTLENAQKESNQMNLMNLEIDDYLKTIENLNEKLKKKEAEYNDIVALNASAEETQKSLQKEIDLMKKGKHEVEEKNRKMKNMILKLKKDLSEINTQVEAKQNKEVGLNNKIEQLSHEVEELKMELSDGFREKEKIQTELQQKLDIQLKAYQTLEVKFARSHSDMTSSQRALDELKDEYENYKVRAHNVLKQQKENSNNAMTEKHQEEVQRLESTITQLRSELSTIQDELKITKDEHEQLEIEYEKQQGLQGEFIKELSEKENRWKSRFKLIKSESDAKDVDHEKKVKLLIDENNKLLQYTKDQMNEIKSENELYTKEIETLKAELQEAQTRSSPYSDGKTTSVDARRSDSNESRTSHLSLEFSKSTMERQEGEGMDQKELELIDTLSQNSSSIPHTPLSPSASSILENILQADSLQTPLAMRDDLLRMRSSLTTSMKKNEHMTALLRESEANASRLSEQAIVLKEEIRRLERNEKREQDLLNMEYLKNVIIKFLKVGSDEKEQLIPVICTMLKLSDEEKKFIMEYAKGECDDENDEHNRTWSSYVYRWTSLS